MTDPCKILKKEESYRGENKKLCTVQVPLLNHTTLMSSPDLFPEVFVSEVFVSVEMELCPSYTLYHNEHILLFSSPHQQR